MYYTLDQQNNLVETDLLTWGKQFEDVSRRIVNKTTTKSGHYVSTVFIGLDHGWGDKIEVFETMIFSQDKDVDEYQERYSTWKEAEENHNKIVEELEAGTFCWYEKNLNFASQQTKYRCLNLI